MWLSNYAGLCLTLPRQHIVTDFSKPEGARITQFTMLESCTVHATYIHNNHLPRQNHRGSQFYWHGQQYLAYQLLQSHWLLHAAAGQSIGAPET